MKENAIVVVTSLLSIVLLTLHVTDDIVRGISKAEPSNTALLILAVLLYGTLVLAERRSGHVIMLLVGLFAAAMPVIHMRGHITARSPSPPAASSSSGHSGRSAGSGASPSCSRRADCGVCDGPSRGSPGSGQSADHAMDGDRVHLGGFDRRGVPSIAEAEHGGVCRHDVNDHLGASPAAKRRTRRRVFSQSQRTQPLGK